MKCSKAKNEVDTDSSAARARRPTSDLKGWLLGATVPVGPGLIRVAYSRSSTTSTCRPRCSFTTDDPKADKFAIGYVHNLSKRTALYATVARIRNKNGAGLTLGGPSFVTSFGGRWPTPPKTSTGYDFGIRHAF